MSALAVLSIPIALQVTTHPMNQSLVFDPELIARYDSHGPRYTSYPTVKVFDEKFDEADYRAIATRSNQLPIPNALSLYLHIPFCDTVCYYCACNKVITKNRARAQQYLSRLIREIEWQGALFDSDRAVVQLHWGGGTPTYLDRDQIRELMLALGRNFNLLTDDSRDYSIEIDPRSVDPETIAYLWEVGFNRFSLGVQDLGPEVRRAVNRIQPIEKTRAVIEACREQGAKTINLDLIYGLPLQTEARFRKTLEVVIDEFRPDRLSVFNYAHLPKIFKTQRQIDASQLPPPSEKLAILESTIEKLTNAGYVHIGMDHFALPGDPLATAQRNRTLQRSFQGYTTHRDCDLVAMGVSAISQVSDNYSQNEKNLDAYSAGIDRGELPIARGLRLSFDDRMRGEIIHQLCCDFRLDIVNIEKNFEVSFDSYFRTELEDLAGFERDGLISLSNRCVQITAQGRLLLRNICGVFDCYSGSSELKSFSRLI